MIIKWAKSVMVKLVPVICQNTIQAFYRKRIIPFTNVSHAPRWAGAPQSISVDCAKAIWKQFTSCQ